MDQIQQLKPFETLKYAVLDCGTNTFNLLVVEWRDETLSTIYNKKFPVKIGKGGIHKGYITEDALDRAEKAIAFHMSTVKELKVDKLQCFATSAMRDASNGPTFQTEMLERYGLQMRIIDGDREADLIYKGVQMAMPISENSIIMDIGGGSTEFILANSNEILWKKSYALGVSRLLEILKPSDPVSQEDITSLHNYLEEQLGELFSACKEYRPKLLIGSSGSFDTLAEMISKIIHQETDFDLPKSAEFSHTELYQIFDRLLPSTLAERLQMDGLVPMRADMIVHSSLFIRYIIEKLKIERTFLSSYALKEGALQEMILNP